MSRRSRSRRSPHGARAWQVAGVAVLAVVAVALSAYALARDPEPPSSGAVRPRPAQTSEPTTAAPSPAPLWAGADLDVSFVGIPDGPPGDPFRLSGGHQTDDSTTPIVRDGALTIDSGGPGAGYAQVEPARVPERIGATFRFGPGGGSGALCLALWDRLIPEPFEVPDSPLHFVITPTSWEYGVWKDGAYAMVDRGTLSEALAQDGTTYSAQVAVRGSTATVTLPDGSTEEVADPRIGSIPGRVLNWEPYLADSGDAKASITRAWAS